MNQRILILQYAGDYREAFRRLSRGEAEHYRGQKYTVDAVSDCTRFGEVTTLTLLTESVYEERLSNGVQAIGLGLKEYPREWGFLLREIQKRQPTHLIVRLLVRELFEGIASLKVRTLAMLAETHTSKGGLRGLLQKWRNRKLARTLNRPEIEWVANHHWSASRWLVEIGVEAKKVIAYDYVYPQSPTQWEAKSLREQPPWVLGYVGMVIDGKGIPEILLAVAQLRSQGIEVVAKIAGTGEIEKFQREAKQLKIEGAMEFLGSIPNDRVIPFMRECDLVLVPSRHTYSESFGFVVQEAFTARTPVIASDHRAFEGRVVHEETGLVFRSGDPFDLSDQIQRLLKNRELNRKLSEASAGAWDRMQIATKWADVIQRWLRDEEADREWLRKQTPVANAPGSPV
jgi:glycosyltransferase involved in cell wall biosynthesis